MATSEQVRQAAELLLALQDRRKHPEGRLDKAGRWYPTQAQDCCEGIRSPSRQWPWALMTHCRTAGHVAVAAGVDVTELRRAARELRKAQP